MQDAVAGVARRLAVVLAGACACIIDDPRTTGAWDESTSDGDASTSTSESDGTTAIADTTDGESTSEASSSSGGDDPPPVEPATYPADRVHSPITASVAMRLRALAMTAPELADDVFMKVGASTDVNANNLHCFAGLDVDYVSCAPYRVPVARLALAQATAQFAAN